MVLGLGIGEISGSGSGRVGNAHPTEKFEVVFGRLFSSSYGE
jgi:hypothetical protein